MVPCFTSDVGNVKLLIGVIVMVGVVNGCGSTATGLLQVMVPGAHANVGIALDGEGDRVVMVDHLGHTVDGDQLLYVIAAARKAAGTLVGPVVGGLGGAFLYEFVGHHRTAEVPGVAVSEAVHADA